MIPLKTIEDLISKHSALEKELSTGEVDKKLFAEKSKEYSDLNDVIDDAKKYFSYEGERKDLEKILEDPSSDNEFIGMAEKELKDLKLENETIEKKLKLFLLPKDEADKKNAIIEIRAGTGGLEASLFASDLFKMYEKVSNKKKWELELISMSQSEAGGLKEVIASIRGKNIYSTLKYESGVHRVQRVPDTETQGRVHTSAATVAVLPEAEEVDVKINDSDLRIDVFRAGGPGGQSVNTTDSAVRITHIPTGLSVSQQDQKSQHKNKAKGMLILRSRLYELERSRIEGERSEDRKSKIGTGDRSERIRTYNFPQGRVTDHRINLTLHKLEAFLEGEAFDEMVESLTLQAQEEKRPRPERGPRMTQESARPNRYENGERRPELSPEQWAELQTKKMTLALDLNSKQQKAVAQLMRLEAKERQVKRVHKDSQIAQQNDRSWPESHSLRPCIAKRLLRVPIHRPSGSNECGCCRARMSLAV